MKDIIKKMVLGQKFWSIGLIFAFLILGCATTKWESNNSRSDAQKARWEKGLEYSQHIYQEPLDFLRDEPFVTTQTGSREQKSPPSAKKTKDTRKGSIVYRVQIAAFQSREAAQKLVQAFRQRFPEELCQVIFDEKWWRVQVGEFVTRAEAELKRNQLSSKGYPDAWIVQAGK